MTGESETVYHIPQGQILSFTRDGETYQAHTCALGSVRIITDLTGDVVARYELDAWGRAISVTEDSSLVGSPMRFVGSLGVRYDSATGLHYMRARWYDSGLGRFISRDPIGLEGGTNLYTYVQNSPANAVDPMGLAEWQPQGHDGRPRPKPGLPSYGDYYQRRGSDGSTEMTNNHWPGSPPPKPQPGRIKPPPKPPTKPTPQKKCKTKDVLNFPEDELAFWLLIWGLTRRGLSEEELWQLHQQEMEQRAEENVRKAEEALKSQLHKNRAEDAQRGRRPSGQVYPQYTPSPQDGPIFTPTPTPSPIPPREPYPPGRGY